MESVLHNQSCWDLLVAFLGVRRREKHLYSTSWTLFDPCRDGRLWSSFFAREFKRPIARGAGDEGLPPFVHFARKAKRALLRAGPRATLLELAADRRDPAASASHGRDARVKLIEGRPVGAMRFVHVSGHRLVVGSTDMGHLAAWAVTGSSRRGGGAPPSHTAPLPAAPPGAQCDMFERSSAVKARYDAKRKYVSRTVATQESRLLYFKIQAQNSRGAAVGGGEDGPALDLWAGDALSGASAAAPVPGAPHSSFSLPSAARSGLGGGASGDEMPHGSCGASTAIAATVDVAADDSGTGSSGGGSDTAAAAGGGGGRGPSLIFDAIASGDRDRRLDDARLGRRRSRGSAAAAAGKGSARSSAGAPASPPSSSSEPDRALSPLEAALGVLWDEGGGGEWRAPPPSSAASGGGGSASKAKGREAWSEADRAKWEAREAKRRERAGAKLQQQQQQQRTTSASRARGDSGDPAAGAALAAPGSPPASPGGADCDIGLAFDASALLLLGAPAAAVPLQMPVPPEGALLPSAHQRRLSCQSAATTASRASSAGGDDDGDAAAAAAAACEPAAEEAGETPAPQRSERQQRKAEEYRRREEERAAKEAAKAARKQQRSERHTAQKGGGSKGGGATPSPVLTAIAAGAAVTSPLALAAASVAAAARVPPPLSLEPAAVASTASGEASRNPSPSSAPRALPARARLLDEARPRAVTPIRGAPLPPRPLPAAGAPPVPGSRSASGGLRSVSRSGGASALGGLMGGQAGTDAARSPPLSGLAGAAAGGGVDEGAPRLPVSASRQSRVSSGGAGSSSEGTRSPLQQQQQPPASPPLGPPRSPPLVGGAPRSPTASGIAGGAGATPPPAALTPAPSRPDVWFCSHWVRPAPRVALPGADGGAALPPALAGSGHSVSYHSVVSFVDGTLGILSPQPLSPHPRDVAARRVLLQPAEACAATPSAAAAPQAAGTGQGTATAVRLVDTFFVSGAQGVAQAQAQQRSPPPGAAAAPEWQQHPACWLTRPPGEDKDHVAAVAVCRGRPLRRPTAAVGRSGAALLDDAEPDVVVAAFGRAVGLWVFPGPPPLQAGPKPAAAAAPGAEDDEDAAGGHRSPRKLRGKKAAAKLRAAEAIAAQTAAAATVVAKVPPEPELMSPEQQPVPSPPPPGSLDVSLAPSSVSRVHTHVVTAVAAHRATRSPAFSAYSDPRVRGLEAYAAASDAASAAAAADPLADVTVVSGDAGGDVAVWNARTLQRVAVLQLHRQGTGSREAVSVVCIDPYIVGAGGVEGTVVLWRRRWGGGGVGAAPWADAAAAELAPDLIAREMDAHSIVRLMVTPATCAAPARAPYFIPVVLTGGGEGAVRLWTYAARGAQALSGVGAPGSSSAPAAGSAESLPVAPPPLVLASSASQSGSGSNVAVKLLKGHGGRVTGLHVDSFRIVSGSLDGAVKVWDLQEPHVGRVLHTLRLPDGVSGLHCAGALLAVGTVSGSILLYDLEPPPAAPAGQLSVASLPPALACHVPLGAGPAAQSALAEALSSGTSAAVRGDGGAIRAGTRKGGAEQAFEAALSPVGGGGGAMSRRRAVQTQRRGIRDLGALVQHHARGGAGERGGGAGDGLDGFEGDVGDGDGAGLGIDGDELARAFELQLRYDEGRA